MHFSGLLDIYQTIFEKKFHWVSFSRKLLENCDFGVRKILSRPSLDKMNYVGTLSDILVSHLQ